MADEPQVRVTLAPIASPLPLTFVGLLLASCILAALDLGWIPVAQARGAGWVLLAVPIPLQLIAAIAGFRGRSATAATGSSSLAAAWLGTALALINLPPGEAPTTRSVGMLSFGVAGALLVPAAADAALESYLPSALLALTAVRFALSGVVAFTGSTGWKHAAGVTGLVVAAAALYAAAALELEDARSRPLLPTFRGRLSRRALDASFAQQVAGVEHEPGVRRQL